MFPLHASIDHNQVHAYDTLKFDEKQMTIRGYPYRFGVANKLEGKFFYRCMECRNIKNKITFKNESATVGTLILYTKERLLKGDVNAPGGYQHLCNDPLYRPLPPATINAEDLIGSLASRNLIESTFYQFDKLDLTIANQRKVFIHIGCTQGVRYYACYSCTQNTDYMFDMNNFLIYNIHQKSLYSNVGGLAALRHVCDDTVFNRLFNRQVLVGMDDEAGNSFETSTRLDFNDDFDTISVLDSASNVGRNKRRHHNFAPSIEYNLKDADSVLAVAENGVGASVFSLPSPPSQTSDAIQSPPKRKNLFTSYFPSFSFIPSSSNSAKAAASSKTRDQQKMDSGDIKPSKGSTFPFDEYPFAIEWTISEDRLKNLQNSSSFECLKSEKFTVVNAPKIQYYLETFPNGNKEERKGETWIFLNLDFETEKKYGAEFTISIPSAHWIVGLDPIFSKEHSSFGESCCERKEFFDAEKKFIVNGKFTVKVEGVIKVEKDEVKWKFSKNFGDLWKIGFEDFTVIVGGKQIRAHKCVLGTESEVFAAMFQQGIEEIEIPDFRFEIAEKALKLCYHGNLIGDLISFDEAVALFKFAEKYAFPMLKENFENILCQLLTISNLCQLFNCAIDGNSQKLKEKCSNFLMICLAKKKRVPNMELLSKEFMICAVNNLSFNETQTL